MIPDDLGPAPAPVRPELAPARARVAAALAADAGPASLAALTGRLGGHPNTTRAHLDALVADGLARATPSPRSGPGRPALSWTLTDAGRRALSGPTAVTAGAELISAMAADLARSPDVRVRARAIGRAWGAARGADHSPAALLSALGDLGFEPERDGDVIRLRTCPILAAAIEHPEVVCAIHSGLVEGATGDAGVRLVPFAERGACRIELRQKAAASLESPKPTLP